MRSLIRRARPRKPDPAPTRIAYRLDRMRLTPAYRLVTRRLLPAAVILGALGGWAAVEDNREAARLLVADLRAKIEERPEFQVKLMAIDGASERLAERIRQQVGVTFPASSLELDFAAMEAQIEALHPVADADLRLRKGGLLQVDVVQRQPALLWRGDGALLLLDRDGVVAGVAEARHLYPDLPVIAGEGARNAASEAVALFAVMGPLQPRLRGLERMGERRWDVVLDQDQRILLPEDGARRVLERAVAMIEAERVLAPAVAALDLRLPRRPTLRLHAAAAERRWDLRLAEFQSRQDQQDRERRP